MMSGVFILKCWENCSEKFCQDYYCGGVLSTQNSTFKIRIFLGLNKSRDVLRLFMKYCKFTYMWDLRTSVFLKIETLSCTVLSRQSRLFFDLSYFIKRFIPTLLQINTSVQCNQQVYFCHFFRTSFHNQNLGIGQRLLGPPRLILGTLEYSIA